VSDTPRTDAVTEHFYNSGVGLRSGSFVEACVARTLERDLNAEKVERVALAVELAQRTAERDALAAEVADLKAERGEFCTTVEMVADLAHAGGLSGKDIHEIFIAIRSLTVDMWTQRGTVEEKKLKVDAAIQEGFRRHVAFQGGFRRAKEGQR
jgi:hypothetical protein